MHPYWLALVAAPLVLACAYRERGQGHSWLGTQGARVLFWACPVALVAWGLRPDLPPLALVLVWVAALIGMIVVPHGAGQDLNVPWETADATTGMDRIARAERLGYLWLAGAVRLLLLAAALWPWVPLPPGWALLGGLALPAGYWLGLYLPRLRWRLMLATEWGEFLSGAGIGLALAIALAA